MAHSLNSEYGISVSHNSEMLEAQFKMKDQSEDTITLSIHTPHHPTVVYDTEDGHTMTLHISPAAPIDEFISFFEEIVSTYKKYKS